MSNFSLKSFFNNSLSDDSCSAHHAGYEEFGNQVRSGIQRGFNNDIQDFSRQPGEVTNEAIRRVTQFQRWFTNIFNVWYIDVTEAGPANDRRLCLTDNFPYDSPGNLDKESVSKVVLTQSLKVVHTSLAYVRCS